MFENRQMMGKRKSRKQVFDLNDDDDQGSTSEDQHSHRLQARFRQHFEASFQPLEKVRQPAIRHDIVESRPTDEGVESDWEGIVDEEQVKAQIVMYQDPHNSKPRTGNEFKNFMVTSALPCIFLRKINLTVFFE